MKRFTRPFQRRRHGFESRWRHRPSETSVWATFQSLSAIRPRLGSGPHPLRPPLTIAYRSAGSVGSGDRATHDRAGSAIVLVGQPGPARQEERPECSAQLGQGQGGQVLADWEGEGEVFLQRPVLPCPYLPPDGDARVSEGEVLSPGGVEQRIVAGESSGRPRRAPSSSASVKSSSSRASSTRNRSARVEAVPARYRR